MIRLELQGFEQFRRRLAALPSKIERRVFRKSLRRVGTKISRRMKKGTPKVTGATRKSVKVKVRVRSGRNGGAYVRIGYTKRPTFTIRLREVGSKRQPARPFFEAAISGWEALAKKDIGDGLEAALKKEEGTLGL